MAFPILALLPAVEKLFDRILPNPEAKAAALLELRKEENAQALQEMQIELQTNKMQADINLEEAKHSNLFVSGARPFIMWTCGVAFAYHYVAFPFAAFALSNYYGKMVLLPAVDMEMISYTLMGILGIGGSMRTYEKVRGVTK
jgi:hypothetical protein